MKKSLSYVLFAVALCAAAFAFGAPATPQKSLPIVPSLAVMQAANPADYSSGPVAPFAPSLVALLPESGGSLIAILAAAGLAFFLFRCAGKIRGGPALTTAINTQPANIGSSNGTRRYRASGALATRYLFGKIGADDEHIAAITATADKPVGVFLDEAAAAEDLVSVALSGPTGRTLPCVASAAIATLNLAVYTDATGKVMIKPTAAGTYWKVGTNLTLAGAANDPVEVATCNPRKLTVVAALTQTGGAIAAVHSTATAPIKADFDALLVAAGELQADFIVLSAALSGDADVTVATT